MMKRFAILLALFLSAPAMAQNGHPAIGYQQTADYVAFIGHFASSVELADDAAVHLRTGGADKARLEI